MVVDDHGTGFRLSSDHQDFRDAVAEFAGDRLAPQVTDWNAKHALPIDAVRAMGDFGLFGLSAPEQFGGAGDFTSLCVAIEEIGYVDQSLGITLSAAVGLGINPIARYGTSVQQDRYLPDLITGQSLAAFGLTEAEAGTDAGATRTRAVRTTDGWLINGSKQFITNSGTELTSVITVTARTGDPTSGRPEITAFCVPVGTPGMTVEPAYDKLGWYASDTHPVTLVDVEVGEDAVLGRIGHGYGQFLATLDDGRVAIAALALGCIRACRDLGVEYARSRHTFGRTIGARQGIAFPLADLDALAHTAELAVYAAAAQRDRMIEAGDDHDEQSSQAAVERRAFKRAASIAKLHACEGAVTATRIATQVFGGYGFMNEYPVARFYRDAKILEIGEGTSEVQRLLIARELGLAVE